MVDFLYLSRVIVSVTIYEKDARMMLMELLQYSEKLMKESVNLCYKAHLGDVEQKRSAYLIREIDRVNHAIVTMKNDIDSTWGDTKF